MVHGLLLLGHGDKTKAQKDAMRLDKYLARL
jgi:hypothetical protein